jgi:hypothetical protein
MLSNDIKLKCGTGDDLTTLTKIDTDNGSSRYVHNLNSTTSYGFRVQNLVTKENPPVGSKRVQLRFEMNKVLSDGSTRTMFASVAISIPRDATFDAADQMYLVKGMYYFLSGRSEHVALSISSDLDGTEWDSDTQEGPLLLTRLLTGEV